MPKDILLIIQIPCLNEEETLPLVLKTIPRDLPGVDVRTLIIDDGSTDRTVEVAQELGVDYIQINHRNQGLAKAFSNGLDASLYLGADIVVNTDGDNQYPSEAIPTLIQPIVNNQADLVVGCRDIGSHTEFSLLKKGLQKLGSKLVSILSGVKVQDATSGFRAMNREFISRTSIISGFTYTLETIIQAGLNGMAIQTMPIKNNPKTRDSRLMKSMWEFVLKQVATIVGTFTLYRPALVFGVLATFFFTLFVLLGLWTNFFIWFADNQRFKPGSALLCAMSFISFMVCLVSCFLGHLSSKSRLVLDEIKTTLKRQMVSDAQAPSHLHILQSSTPGSWKSEGKSKPEYTKVA